MVLLIYASIETKEPLKRNEKKGSKYIKQKCKEVMEWKSERTGKNKKKGSDRNTKYKNGIWLQ